MHLELKQYTRQEINLLKEILKYEKKTDSNEYDYSTTYINVSSNKIIGKNIKTNTHIESLQQKKIHEYKEKTLLIAKKLQIFRGVDLNDIYLMIKDQKMQTFHKGEQIITKENSTSRLNFLISGSVKFGNITIDQRYMFINIDSYVINKVMRNYYIADSDKTQVFSFHLNDTHCIKIPNLCKKIYLNIASYLLIRG